MFRKSKPVQLTDINQQEISTIIGEGFVINGELTGSSVVRIDGKVIGNVRTDGGVILGEKGTVIGDLETTYAIIYGVINGKVKANQLQIKRTGKVDGDIKTETLEIESGAQYNGKLEMKQMIKQPQIQIEELSSAEL